jgi:hypothetical protein
MAQDPRTPSPATEDTRSGAGADTSAAPAIDGVLAETLAIVEPLVTWLVRSGVGHAQFAAALKPLFLDASRRELDRQDARTTDSALSLLSGLHRKDVRAAREQAQDTSASLEGRRTRWGRPSLASQVLSRWLSQPDLAPSLPLNGEAPSFEALSRSVSSDFRPRAILQELERLALVRIEDDQVHRLADAFTPDRRGSEARALFAGAAADHLQAGVHNLSGLPGSFLEQSVFADGLSAASIAALNQLANQIWAQARDQLIEAAVPLCELDRDTPEPRRFRLGLYSYHAPETGASEERS